MDEKDMLPLGERYFYNQNHSHDYEVYDATGQFVCTVVGDEGISLLIDILNRKPK